MTLADTVAASKLVTKARILIVDIERIPGRARHQHRGLTIEGDFWDLSSWKHTIGYRLPPDSVIEWPRTICGAWRWYGAKRVEFAAEWTDGHETMLRKFWDLYDEADIIVGHNVNRFDTRKLKGEWWLTEGMKRPSPYKMVDTLTVAHREFDLESNTLDALLKRHGHQGKSDRYEVAKARAAVAGDKAAQRYLAAYNRGDIIGTEFLYDLQRGWNPTHPHLGLYNGDERSCAECGGTEFTPLLKDPKTFRTGYGGYRCANPTCQAPSRNNHRRTIVTMVPAR